MVSINFRINYGISKEEINNALKNIGYENIGVNSKAIKVKDEYLTTEVFIRNTTNGRYHCHYCGYRAKSSSALKSHLAHRHDIGVVLYKCPYCRYKAKMKKTLKKHIYNKHNPNPIKYQCSECKFKTKYKHNIKSHLYKVHHILRDYNEIVECMVCNTPIKNMRITSFF